MKPRRADLVPVEPVTRAIREFLKENGISEARGGWNNQSEDRYYSPLDTLAERLGVAKDTVWRHSRNDRGYTWMEFDTADAYLCATNRVDWWWRDPELSPHYEGAVIGADKVSPIKEPEPPKPQILVCEWCDGTFEMIVRHGSPRRFCSSKCRQANHTALRKAA